MRIAIHAADLDHERIDGPRVYILNMLKNFGAIDQADSFWLYHRNDFNLHLTPPSFPSYAVKKISAPFLWTQTGFALKLLSDKPDVLWMPVQNMPIIRRKNLKTVVTIHDLAFKIFPQHFTKKDLFKLNKLADLAIKNADRIIAISNSTKNDIIKFYPKIDKEKISVIYNGFDAELFNKKTSEKDFEKFSISYDLKPKNYLLYVGAIQPRKNLITLIEAFEKIKKDNPNLKLVLAGAPAWKSEKTLEKIDHSLFKDDIIVTGRLPFKDVPVLYQNALVSVYPSLYEGFGIPVLEAMASGVPVICANNSSLPEVGGDAAMYFKTEDSSDLAGCIERLIQDENLRNEFVRKGMERARNFSSEKSARETLDKLTKW